MNTFKKLRFLIFMVLTVNTLSAQNLNEIINKVNSYYTEATTYNIESTYTMFRGYTGTNVTELYEGTMYKKKDVVGMTALGTEVITFCDIQLTISDKKKLIAYTKKNSKEERLIDGANILKFYDQTAKREEKNILIYEVSLKKGMINVPYNKLIFHINKQDFSLLKQEFFFTSKQPFKNSSGDLENDYGRMVISYNHKASSFNSDLKVEDYLIIHSDGKVSLSKAYENYQLINQTPYN